MTTEISSRFVQLLCALPRNSLRAFTTSLHMDERTIGLVLKTQAQLSHLAFPFETLHDKLLKGNLDELTNLTLWLRDEDKIVRSDCLALAPKLETLSIKPRAELADKKESLPVWTIPKLKHPLQLRSLEISCSRFHATESSFGGLTNLSKLQTLLLHNCPEIALTTQSLAKEFLKSESSALKSLIIRHTCVPDSEKPFDVDLESLLQAVPALESLCITAFSAKPPAIETICRHGTALRYLHIDHFPDLFAYQDIDPPDIERYTPREVERLVSSCPDIEGLSLNLVGLVFDDDEVNETFDLPIAKLRNLRNLRITHPLFHPEGLPPARVPDPVLLALNYQSRYQSVAESIMQFLVEHESPVKLLAFGPGYHPRDMFPSSRDIDANQHRYSHFYYLRGIVTVTMRGGAQVTRGTAVPVEEYSEHEEMLFWK